MDVKTPLTIITGFLGSGKTTLLKHVLKSFPRKIAILMNEFGEISIDSKIIKGKNIEITELSGGCVCCSLVGEFEAAIVEIIENIDPEYIIVETTGIAEPDALIFDIQESLPMVRLDGIITIIDADLMLRFPQIGRTTRMQIEDADVLALNKSDLVTSGELSSIKQQIKDMNSRAPIIQTQYCQLDSQILFGIARKLQSLPQEHRHQLEYQSLSFKTHSSFSPKKFKRVLNELKDKVCRGKGFVNFSEGTFLFNFVNGRWELEPFEKEETALVFIGKNLEKDCIIKKLKSCEQ